MSVYNPLLETPVLNVFSIPELANHIGLYLRPIHIKRLSLVSKTFYSAYVVNLMIPLSSFVSLDETIAKPDKVRALAQRVRGVNLDLQDDLTSPTQNRLLNIVYTNFTLVDALKIEYWGEDLVVLRQVIHQMPQIRCLSVALMTCTKAPDVILSLIGVREEQVNSGMKCNLNSLKLIIKFGDAITWQTFKRLLRFYPELKSIDLSGVSILKGENPSAWDPIDFEEDSSLKDSRILCQYTNMETLKLSNCGLNGFVLSHLDTLFPKLQDLELSGCNGDWIPVLDRRIRRPEALSWTAAREFHFPELRSLVIWLDYQSNRANLVNLVRGRPHLSVLMTDLLASTRDEFMKFVDFCSKSDIDSDVGTNSDGSVVSEASDDSAVTSTPNMFKSLSLQTYSSLIFPPGTLEKFYKFKCFRELEYVYIQKRELSIDDFPFAKTLKRLSIGGRVDFLTLDEQNSLKSILRQLPVLEEFRLDREMRNYALFTDLGRASSSEDQSYDSQSDHAVSERPYLYSLEIMLRRPYDNDKVALTTPESLRLTKADDDHLDLEALRKQIISRFRLLERLKVHLCGIFKLPDELDQWKNEIQYNIDGIPIIEFT
ncbi:hypothetical protein BGZ76_000512, partial [Entomortierella beljakovae]